MDNERNAYAGPTNWAAAPRATVGGQASSGSNSWDMDLKPLEKLETHLKNIVNLFGQLDTKIKTATTGLKGMGVPGATAGTGSGLSAAPVTAITATGQAAATAAKAGQNIFSGGGGANPNQTQGPGGTGNTSAGFGGAGTFLAATAGLNIAAGIAGKVSSFTSSLQQGGVPVQLAAAQQATITGGSTIGNVNAWNQVLNTGQADQAQAMNMQMQNNFLGAINPQSKSFNNLRGMLNATQQLGGLSATSAMGFLNDLTSNQATNFFTQRSGGLAGPLNPRTGQLRSPQQALLSTLQAAGIGQGMTGSALSSTLKNVAGNGGLWSVAAGNLEQGAGLSSSDVELLRQFASSGGNLKKATGGQMSKTVAEQLVAQTTQGTATSNTLMQDTSGLQVAFSKLDTSASHLEQVFTGWANTGLHGLLSHVPGGSGIAGTIGKIASFIPGLGGLGFLGDPASTGGMQPNLARGINAMKAANPSIKINSGYRTNSQQAALYALKGGHQVARPGQSPHQLGKAADLGPSSQHAWIAANASKFGLATDKHEPWHVQVGDPNTASSVTGAQVVGQAQTQLGVNYQYGGETAGKAFDCSGLVQWVFAQVGVSLPRTSQAQATVGKPVNGLNNAQAGDIILYNEPGEGPNSHVAIYIGGGKQIAAPHTGTTVQVQAVDTSHISCIRRVIGGGAGGKVVAAAQGAVGQSSSDSSNHSGAGAAVSAGAPGGLSNSFIAGLSGSWLGGGGVAGAGGGGGGGGGGPAAGGSSGSSGSTTTASTGSTALVGGGGGPISNPTGFSKAVLSGLGLPATNADVTNLNAWQQMEGQWGARGSYNAMQMHDPLNTNLPEKGGHALNGTWSYPDWTTGVNATVSTIRQGNMSAIYNALKSNDNLASFGTAAESTPWASSAYGGKSWPTPSGTYAVGDPEGGFSPAQDGQSYGGPGPVSSLRSGGGRGGGGVSVAVGPIYVQGTQADANNIANMVASAIKGHREIQAVAKS